MRDEKEYANEKGGEEPYEELGAREEGEELIESMRGFRQGAERAYQNRADCDKDCAEEGVSGEGFAQNEACAYRIEDQAGLLLSAEIVLFAAGRGKRTACNVDSTGSGRVVI